MREQMIRCKLPRVQQLQNGSYSATIVILVPYDVVLGKVTERDLQQPNSRPSHTRESMFFSSPYKDARSFPQRNLPLSDLHLNPFVKSYPEFFPVVM
jgi:hypothetical protein